MALWNTTPDEWTKIYRALEAGLTDGTLSPLVAMELPLATPRRAHQRILEPAAKGKIGT